MCRVVTYLSMLPSLNPPTHVLGGSTHQGCLSVLCLCHGRTGTNTSLCRGTPVPQRRASSFLLLVLSAVYSSPDSWSSGFNKLQLLQEGGVGVEGGWGGACRMITNSERRTERLLHRCGRSGVWAVSLDASLRSSDSACLFGCCFQ